jgi:hypothetical protein
MEKLTQQEEEAMRDLITKRKVKSRNSKCENLKKSRFGLKLEKRPSLEGLF